MKRPLAAIVLSVCLFAACGSDASPSALPVQVSAGAGSTKLAAPEVASDMSIGGVEYEVDGDLPELDDEAAAWEVPFESSGPDRVRELADALGVDGDVERTEFGWSVVDGSVQLEVQRQAGLPWNLYDARLEMGTMSSGAACAPELPCPNSDPPRRPEGLPSKAEAEKLGRARLEALGIDLDDARVQVEDGFSTWYVMVDPQVGGLPVIGMTTSVAIGADGKLAFANGWLAEPEESDVYPLIGTKAALQELRDEQVVMFDAPAGAEPMIARCDPAADCVDPEPMKPQVVRITGVHLGLQLFSSWEQGKPAYLVPSYFFETADGGELPIVGLDEEFFSPPPVPEPEPLPEPGVSGGSGGGSCSGSASGGAGDDEGESVSLCGSSAADVGEELRWVVKTTCDQTLSVDFGDGTVETVTAPEVTHTYEAAGRYMLKITPRSCATSASSEIVIGDEPNVTTTTVFESGASGGGSTPRCSGFEGTPTTVCPVEPADPDQPISSR